MGQAMAKNLLHVGHKVTVYNRTRQHSERLAAEGAHVAETPAGAALEEAAITMLADDRAVEAVIFGENGLLEAMLPGALHISMSTISAALSERLAAAHREKGQRYLAAPVFGRPEAAAAAKLFIVAAGAKADIAEAQPLFDAMGQRTFDVGEKPEQANILKLCGNFLISCVIESMSEVFAVSAKAGVEASTVFDLFTSTLFSAPVYKTYGTILMEKKFSPAAFKLALGFKDNRLMLEAAANLQTPMPFASVVRDQFLSALANGRGDLDWSAFGLAVQQNAGLPVK